MKNKLTKTEKVLFMQHRVEYDVISRFYITISPRDDVNILKVNSKMLEHCNYILKRSTLRIKIAKNRYIYFNIMFGG